MAIYHCSFQILTRNPQNPQKSGCNALAAAAYRAGEKLGQWNFENKGKFDVSYKQIFLPEGAPNWAKDRYALWQSVEEIEKRKDAQLAREVNFALPIELSKNAKIELAKKFAENFSAQGMVADLFIHKIDSTNPHAHIMLSTRTIGPEGWGKKNRAWNDKEILKGWREAWENLANDALKNEMIKERISHRSLADQGINRPPTWHVGRAGKALSEKADIETRSMEHNRLVREYVEAQREEERLFAELSEITRREKAEAAEMPTSQKEEEQKAQEARIAEHPDSAPRPSPDSQEQHPQIHQEPQEVEQQEMDEQPQLGL